jgi:hypothetical protein
MRRLIRAYIARRDQDNERKVAAWLATMRPFQGHPYPAEAARVIVGHVIQEEQ